MRHMTNAELMTQITDKMFLGDMETDILAEAFAAASRAGVDVNAAVRSLFTNQERLNLPVVLAALKPSPAAGGTAPYHLPDCDCAGTGWVNTEADGAPTTSAIPTGFVARCPGPAVTEDAYRAWQARQPKPEPKQRRMVEA